MNVSASVQHATLQIGAGLVDGVPFLEHRGEGLSHHIVGDSLITDEEIRPSNLLIVFALEKSVKRSDPTSLGTIGANTSALMMSPRRAGPESCSSLSSLILQIEEIQAEVPSGVLV